MKLKHGVSMIVLIITLIIMAILATIVIVSLEETDIINKTKTTVSDTNLIQVTELVSTAWNNANSELDATLEDLQQAVNDAVELNHVDTTEYNIIVTTEKVYVSKDFTPPIITNSSMVYTNNTVEVDLTFGRVVQGDYPLVVEYYIKPASVTSEDGYELINKVIISSGVAANYQYTGLEAGTAYNIKMVVRDINGNTASTTLNVTTQG